MMKIAVGGSKINLLIQGESFQNVFTQDSSKRTCGADICGTAVVLYLWRDLGTAMDHRGDRRFSGISAGGDPGFVAVESAGGFEQPESPVGLKPNDRSRGVQSP
jgi:hypothetical protein